MDSLRQYVVSVVTAALIFGMISGLVQNGAAKEVTRLLCGVFLAVTAIRPIVGLDFSMLTEYPLTYAQEGTYTAAMGEKMAQQSMAEIIKAESEAYILDKAAELNAELSVAVTVSEDQIPVFAELSGEISPYARRSLENILASDLGIAKENQLWTG